MLKFVLRVIQLNYVTRADCEEVDFDMCLLIDRFASQIKTRTRLGYQTKL